MLLKVRHEAHDVHEVTHGWLYVSTALNSREYDVEDIKYALQLHRPEKMDVDGILSQESTLHGIPSILYEARALCDCMRTVRCVTFI